MYRVELKVQQCGQTFCEKHTLVPNAPCGVESIKMVKELKLIDKVFLMHRVELKERQK